MGHASERSGARRARSNRSRLGFYVAAACLGWSAAMTVALLIVRGI